MFLKMASENDEKKDETAAKMKKRIISKLNLSLN